MQKFAAVFLCAFCCSQPVLAARAKVSEMITVLEAGKKSLTPSQNLEQFIADTALDCKKFDKVEGLLIGNLVKGLMEADKVNDIQWAGNVLTVNLKNKVYGQIATRSTVPIMWVVDETLTATYSSDSKTVSLEGLHTDVPKQAYRIYEEIMADRLVAAKQFDTHCADPDSDECQTYLGEESKATKEWYRGLYNEYLKAYSKDFEATPSPKVSKVLIAMLHNLGRVMRAMIKWENWGNIVYSIITASPKNVTSLVFDDCDVVATAVPWAGSENSKKAEEYNLLKKSQILGAAALTKTPKKLQGVLKNAAKSGWGFGMMCGHGDPEVAELLGAYDKAYPPNMVNLFSHCSNGEEANDPPCKGDERGRIHWTDEVPYEYQ